MLIGLHGKARSGKDESYRFIKEWAESQGRTARREAFADRLKLNAAKSLGYVGTREECLEACNQLKLPGWQIVVVGPDGCRALTGRKYIQLYGRSHREDFGLQFWIDLLFAHYDPSSSDLLVITDVRCRNEAVAIRDFGGEVWEIIRPGMRIAEDDDETEQPLDSESIDRVIVNAGDLHDLQAMVQTQIAHAVPTPALTLF